MFADAALEALEGAGADRLDAIYVGNMSGGQFVGQEHLGPLMAEQIGMSGVPAVRVESACASGGHGAPRWPGWTWRPARATWSWPPAWRR
jgi:acetyl-CoA C-acetyltransferase